jgi:dihydrofolate synthase/folylpolyglutamate synthase
VDLSRLKERGIQLQLDTISTLLRRLGDPQERYRTVHVGGTNGKGSVAAFVASMVQESGRSVGLYTSPHLVGERERIRVNGGMIRPEEFDDAARALEPHLPPETTYFEFLTALAFHYFHLRKVDCAVIEVGLGGRLDATNVLLHPDASIVTNISREHERYLGRRLEDIALEKGGIVKSGGSLVTGASQPVVRAALKRICGERRSGFYLLGKDFRVRSSRSGDFSYRGLAADFRDLSLSMPGAHQVRNAALALCAVEILSERGLPVDEPAVRRGLKKAVVPGRMEILRRDPTVVADGAHNPAAVAVLLQALRDRFRFRRLGFVFGVLADKDYRAMLRKILPVADWIIFSRPESERALDPEILLPFARKKSVPARVVEDPGEALRAAVGKAGSGDLVCVTGSLYLLGVIYRGDPPFQESVHETSSPR